MSQGVELSKLSIALFKAFKARLEKDEHNSLAAIKIRLVYDKAKLSKLMVFLKNNNFIEYDRTMGLIIIRLTEKGIMRIIDYDNW